MINIIGAYVIRVPIIPKTAPSEISNDVNNVIPKDTDMLAINDVLKNISDLELLSKIADNSNIIVRKKDFRFVPKALKNMIF